MDTSEQFGKMPEKALIVEHSCKKGQFVYCHIIPDYLLLSERMGNGESLEELAEKAHKIIKGTQ